MEPGTRGFMLFKALSEWDQLHVTTHARTMATVTSHLCSTTPDASEMDQPRRRRVHVNMRQHATVPRFCLGSCACAQDAALQGENRFDSKAASSISFLFRSGGSSVKFREDPGSNEPPRP